MEGGSGRRQGGPGQGIPGLRGRGPEVDAEHHKELARVVSEEVERAALVGAGLDEQQRGGVAGDDVAEELAINPFP